MKQCCNYGPVVGQSGRLLAIQELATFARLLLITTKPNGILFWFPFQTTVDG